MNVYNYKRYKAYADTATVMFLIHLKSEKEMTPMSMYEWKGVSVSKFSLRLLINYDAV